LLKRVLDDNVFVEVRAAWRLTQNWRRPLARPAKRKHRLGFIAGQSEIKDVKVVPHVGAVRCASERQHPELKSETKYHLWNRLVVVTSDLGRSRFQENLAISGK
jgi:hypothetical protein